VVFVTVEREAGGLDSAEVRMTQAIEWVTYVGGPVYDEDGNVIGLIEEFFVETDDGPPAWAAVTRDAGDTARSYVPMRDARAMEDGHGLQVPVGGGTVRDAPTTSEGDDLSAEQERRLYEHYGQAYPVEESSDNDKDREDGTSDKPGFLRRLLRRDPS
jgi:hypothetical protein